MNILIKEITHIIILVTTPAKYAFPDACAVFISSASSIHPEKTDRHPGLTKAKHEFYPYAIWGNNIDFDKDAPKGYDVKLVFWNSKPNCYCSLVQ